MVEAVPRPLAAVAAAPLLLQCTSKQWWAAPMGLDVEFLLAQEARGGHRMSLDLEARRRGGLFAPDEAGRSPSPNPNPNPNHSRSMRLLSVIEHLEGTAAAPLLTRPPQRRSETCFPEEEPQPEPPPKPKPPPGAQHSVEVASPNLAHRHASLIPLRTFLLAPSGNPRPPRCVHGPGVPRRFCCVEPAVQRHFGDQ